MQNFSIIAAMDDERGIGRAGTLAWQLRGDMNHFRDITVGNGNNAVIMGSVTWFSLPEKVRPLPKRKNIVLNGDGQEISGAASAKDFDSALQLAQGANEVFVIGGGSVYAFSIKDPRCTKVYVTRVAGVHQCEVFFPEFEKDFRLVSKSEPMTEGQETYWFEEYIRADEAQKS